MQTLTNAEITRLAELEAKATKGEWTVYDLGDDHFDETNHRWAIGSKGALVYRIAKVEGLGVEYEANAQLMANAKRMLATIAALKAENDDMKRDNAAFHRTLQQ